MVKRGDVWLCRLDPTVGSAIQKTRPCVIVSPDDLNQRAPVMIVAPLTSGSRPTRFRIAVQFRGKDGLILPDQTRVLDRQRLVKRLGALEAETLGAVLAVLGEMFAP